MYYIGFTMTSLFFNFGVSWCYDAIRNCGYQDVCERDLNITVIRTTLPCPHYQDDITHKLYSVNTANISQIHNTGMPSFLGEKIFDVHINV